MGSHNFFAATFLLAVLSVPTIVNAQFLTAEQAYANGAFSSIIMDVDIFDVGGIATIQTVGSGINSPDSFVSGTFISQSGFVYLFDENAITTIIDAYVDTPLSDLSSGNTPTGTVWYHFTFDTSILGADCALNPLTSTQCFAETPTEFSEYAIWGPVFSLNTGSVTISLASVPIPAAVWLFGSGLIGLIGLAKRKKS